MDRTQAAAVLRGLADEHDRIQEIDSNAAGFVARIRGLQLKAAEVVLQLWRAEVFAGKPFEERLDQLVAGCVEQAAAVEGDDSARAAWLRLNVWLGIVGLNNAKFRRSGGKTKVLSLQPDPLIPSPYDDRALRIAGLEDPKNFAAESARASRLHAAFILRALADAAEETAAAERWSNYRSPKQWRKELEIVGASHSPRQWTFLREKHAGEIEGTERTCRITERLAVSWNLSLPEFGN